MALINFTQIEPQAEITSSGINTPLKTIYDDYNGNIDSNNLAANAVTTAKITDANVTTVKIADANVTNAKLAGGAGQPGGAWTAWTPTLSGRFNDAKWTKNCKYTQIGKTVHFKVSLVANATGPMDTGSGAAVFTLPVTSTAISASSAYINPIGQAALLDAGTARAMGQVDHSSTTAATIRVNLTDTTYLGNIDVTNTVPWTWTTNDEIYCEGTYEAA